MGKVYTMADGAKSKHNQRTQWLKLQAVQVVSNLPENYGEALRVLEYAKEIVERFLHEEGGGSDNVEKFSRRSSS